eukprot:scaffold65956_cov57-Phaeocystis_antarctica.AAC.3
MKSLAACIPRASASSSRGPVGSRLTVRAPCPGICDDDRSRAGDDARACCPRDCAWIAVAAPDRGVRSETRFVSRIESVLLAAGGLNGGLLPGCVRRALALSRCASLGPFAAADVALAGLAVPGLISGGRHDVSCVAVL